MKTPPNGDRQITADGRTYRASVSNGLVSISYLDSGRWIWAGNGTWTGRQIEDCAANIPEEAYTALDAALASA